MNFYIVEFLKEHYPNADNKILSAQLGLSESYLRGLASKHRIYKSKDYTAKRHQQLISARKEAYYRSIPKILLTEIERNILVGSILGDGSIDPGPKRSVNCFYKERFSQKQLEYRVWKKEQLSRLNFKTYKNFQLASPSHPIFTDLRHTFYLKNKKTITEENIRSLSHPIGLACLYLDDGSLIMSHGLRGKKIYVSPQISISTHSFTKEENEILQSHIVSVFNIQFYLKKHPDGYGYHLQLGKIQEINKLISLIRPYVQDISCMQYKIDIESRLQEKKACLLQKCNHFEIKVANIFAPEKSYSQYETEKILTLKRQGVPVKEIALQVSRSYWGVVDKIRRLASDGHKI